MSATELGQNFLVNKNVARKIVDNFHPTTGEILEIGPGKGILTSLLLERFSANRITLVEVDQILAGELVARFGKSITVLNQNILNLVLDKQFPEKPVSIISNIPYYISREIIDWIIYNESIIQNGIFMIQKEFADKLTGVKVNAQGFIFEFLYRVKKLFDVKPGSFSPSPKVKSTVITFLPSEANRKVLVNVGEFYDFLKTCFMNRRKTLLNNLTREHKKSVLQEILMRHNLPLNVRAENLKLADLLNVFISF